MNAYTQHMESRKRDMELHDRIMRPVMEMDAIANEFKDDDELIWRRRLAQEIKYLREELKNA